MLVSLAAVRALASSQGFEHRGWQDIEAVDPDFFKNLVWMLENDIEGVLDLTFTEESDYFGRTELVDLKPDGSNIKVTEATKREYVDLVARHRMTTAIKPQIQAFLGGFWELVPKVRPGIQSLVFSPVGVGSRGRRRYMALNDRRIASSEGSSSVLACLAFLGLQGGQCRVGVARCLHAADPEHSAGDGDSACRELPESCLLPSHSCSALLHGPAHPGCTLHLFHPAQSWTQNLTQQLCCVQELITIFNDLELELLISGLPDIDVGDLRANTEYSGYTAAARVIQWFWECVDDMGKQDRALLVQFVTGTSKVPLDGFRGLQVRTWSMQPTT